MSRPTLLNSFGQVWLVDYCESDVVALARLLPAMRPEIDLPRALLRGRYMAAYASGDPYLTFAKQAGTVPADATKATQPKERGQFKVCALAVQYGTGARSLGQSLGVPEAQGRELLRLHRQTYPDFWRWSNAAVNHAMLRGWLRTVFGWTVRVGPNANPRSLANFPVQGNGAEMLRLAGFELRTEAKIVRWPDRYMDERGSTMWETIMEILMELEGESSGLKPLSEEVSAEF